MRFCFLPMTAKGMCHVRSRDAGDKTGMVVYVFELRTGLNWKMRAHVKINA